MRGDAYIENLNYLYLRCLAHIITGTYIMRTAACDGHRFSKFKSLLVFFSSDEYQQSSQSQDEYQKLNIYKVLYYNMIIIKICVHVGFYEFRRLFFFFKKPCYRDRELYIIIKMSI